MYSPEERIAAYIAGGFIEKVKESLDALILKNDISPKEGLSEVIWEKLICAAARRGNIEIMEYLIAHAVPFTRKRELRFLISAESVEMVYWLCNHFKYTSAEICENNIITHIPRVHPFEKIRYLCDRFDLPVEELTKESPYDSNGGTLLAVACITSDLPSLEWLLERIDSHIVNANSIMMLRELCARGMIITSPRTKWHYSSFPITPTLQFFCDYLLADKFRSVYGDVLLQFACTNGVFDLLRYLHARDDHPLNVTQIKRYWYLLSTCQNEETLIWIADAYPELATDFQDSVPIFCKYDFVRLLSQLHGCGILNRENIDMSYAIHECFTNGRLELLQWIDQTFEIYVSDIHIKSVQFACSNTHYDLLQYACDRFNLAPSYGFTEDAIARIEFDRVLTIGIKSAAKLT
jgi:ankyrin repeat protein